MLPSRIPSNIWELLEQLYLDSANCQDGGSYAGLADDAKRAILKEFAQEQSVTSSRWANIAQNVLWVARNC